MAFQFSFLAKTPDDAKTLTNEANAPQQVKDFILLAIQGIVSRGITHNGIEVSTHGHLCDGKDSPLISNVTIHVRPAL